MTLLTNAKDEKEIEKVIIDQINWQKTTQYIKAYKHSIGKNNLEYILIDDVTGERYIFDKIIMNFPNDIIEQVEKNIRLRKAKEIDKEWLYEKDKYKRRRIYSKNYFRGKHSITVSNCDISKGDKVIYDKDTQITYTIPENTKKRYLRK